MSNIIKEAIEIEDYSTFTKNVPAWFDCEKFEEFTENVMSVQTRRKMAQSARRTAKKRARTRKRKTKRMKSKGQLLAKAQKEAKMKLRKKLFGISNWSSLSMSAKMQMDKKLASKTKVINKLAKKLYPKVKVAEKERLKRVRSVTPGQSKLKEDTFKKKAVRDVNAKFKKEKAKIDKEIEKIKKNLDSLENIKSLEDQLEVIRKKKEEAEKRIEASKKRLEQLRKKLKKGNIEEDYAKLKDRRAYLKKTVKQRTARTLARRKMEKEGKCCKGDGKDVDHKNGNPEDNSSGNLRVMSASKNRGRDNNKWRKKANEEHGAGEEGTNKLLKRYSKETPEQNINKIFRKRVGINGK